MPLLVEVDMGPRHWLGAYGPLLVFYWIGNVDPSVYRALPRLTRAYCAKQSEGQVAVLSISFLETRVPSADARAALVTLVKATDQSVQRIAVVRECEGFVSSIMSSVIAAVQMLAKPNSAHKSFRSIHDAVPWATANLRDFQVGHIRVADAVDVLTSQLELFKTRYRVAS